ncbi:conserved hypothetical protein [Paraburkholderia tropica]|nr:conserved hypothetical protein [Paraburkholderia tropica]
MFVQFSDATSVKIVACFSCAQDAAVFPNQGEVDEGDERWATYYASLPEMAQASLPAPQS